MPGPYGIVTSRGDVDPRETGRRMRDLLRHQSWYGEAASAGAHHHLGVLSTSPHFTAAHHLAEDGAAVLVLDGDALTLDGADLPPDDPDLAGRLLKEWRRDGGRLGPRLGGRFNLVIHDRRERAVELWNDRLGFAHLYWCVNDGDLLLAPELKAFLARDGLDRELDEGAVALFFCHDGLMGDRTFLRAVKLLPPASRLVWRDGRVRITTYWRPEYDPDETRRPEDLVAEGCDLFRLSVARRLPAPGYPRVHVPLSGGLDSRLLLTLAAERQGNLTIHTHGHPRCLDWRFGRRVSAALDLADRHRLLPYRPESFVEEGELAVWLNDGQVTFRNAPLIDISRRLEPGPVPFLNGILGAYLSLGSGHFYGPDDIRVERDPDRLRRRVLRARGLEAGHAQLDLVLRPAVAERWRRESAQLVWDEFQNHRHHELFCDQLSSLTHLNLGRRMQVTIDVHRFFFHDLLPFADDGLFALGLRIPARLKMEHALYREMFRRHFWRLASLPWAHTGHDLFAPPAAAARFQARRLRRARVRQLVHRLSRGVVNLPDRDDYQQREIWFRRHAGIRDLVRPVLRAAADTGLDWFDPDRIDALLRRYDGGRDYHWTPIARLFTFLTWHRLFVHDGHRSAPFARSGPPAGAPVSGREPVRME